MYMKTIAKLRLLLAIALGTLTVTCVLLFLGMVTEVSADPPTSWYVAPGGMDSPTCGQEVSPCLTINHAISQASNGATIVVTPGTFTESLTLNKAVTLTGAGMGQAIIRASSPGITVTASNVTISGTTVVGEGSGEGIIVTAGLTNASILNNEIQSYTSGIQLNGGNGHLLQGNVIAGNSIGLVAAGDLAFVANNNTISGSLTAGILFTGAGPITATLSGASDHANIFRNNTTNITVALPSTNANINAHWNDWGTNTIAGIEETIYHAPDDAALARVDFYTLTIAAAPPTAVADGAASVHITGTLGSFVPPGAGDVISFTTSLGRLNAVTATTNASGQASVALTSTIAGTAVIAATSGAASPVTATIYFSPGVPYSMTIVANPLLLTVGFSSVLQLTVRDQYLNPVADGTQVTFTPDWGNILPVTTTNGSATSSIATTIAGTDRITATSGTARVTTTVIFRPDAPNSLVLQSNPSQQVVGTNSVLTATVRDRYNNLVESGIPVTFTVSRGSVVSPVTTTNGIAASLISDTLVGARLVTATTTGAVSNTTTVTFIPGAPHTVALQAYPLSLVVGNNSVLTATVHDQYGNTVGNGTPVTFTVSRGSVVSPVTTTNGVATSLFSDTLRGTRTITATTALKAVSDTTTVTFVPGGPYSMTLTAVPPSPLVGFTSVLNVTVRDQYSNTVADGTEVTFTSDWGNIDPLVVTTTNGAAPSYIATTIAGADHVTATSETAYATTTVTFRPDVPNSLVLQSDPSQQVVGNNSVLTATVRDTYNNLVGSGIPVTFTVSRGSVVSRTVTTNGVATSRISDTLTGTRTITATTLRTVSDTTTVTFIPGAPFTVTLVATPTVQVVGQNSVLTATVYDRYANRVENGTPVTLTVSRGSVASPVTTTNGVATSLFSDTLRGTRTITATSGSAPPVTRTVTFTTDKPFTITVQVYPLNLIANSGATATVTATVMDVYENPIAGQVLTGSFPITSMGTVSISGATGAEGRAVGTWTAGSIISHTRLYVSNGSITGSQEVSLIGLEPAMVVVQVNPSSLIANSDLTSTITATVTDILGNGIEGISLEGTFLPSSLGSLGPFPFTNADGQAFSTWTAGHTMGSGILRVRWTDNSAISGTAAITLTHGAPQTVTVQVTPSVLTARSGATATITATVIDPYHNSIRGLTSSGDTSPATLGSVSGLGTTNENGQAFGLWTATLNSVGGSGLLRVDVGGVIGTTPITLTPGHVYLPVVMRDFETALIKNGHFSRPDLAYWNRDQNPLPVSPSTDNGNPAALLGNPAYPCGNVPTGTGSLSQSFIMPDTQGKPLVLTFNYHIITDDQNPQMNLDQDRFDVLLNGISVFSDMNRSNGYGCGNHAVIGPRTQSVTVTGFSPGESVNLTFRVRNGTVPDSDFNTYVYVDDVQLEFE